EYVQGVSAATCVCRRLGAAQSDLGEHRAHARAACLARKEPVPEESFGGVAVTLLGQRERQLEHEPWRHVRLRRIAPQGGHALAGRRTEKAQHAIESLVDLDVPRVVSKAFFEYATRLGRVAGTEEQREPEVAVQGRDRGPQRTRPLPFTDGLVDKVAREVQRA